MTVKLPEGTLIKVEAEIRLPAGATYEQVAEWLPYALFQRGGCSLENPLVNESADDWGMSFDWEDTGMIGAEEKFDHRDNEDGSKSCKIRYRRERRQEAA